MTDSSVTAGTFDEFFEYFFDLEEMLSDYEEGRMDTKRFEGDRFERYERLGHKMAHLGDPGWAIYEDIDQYGEAEVLKALTEDLIEKGEEQRAGSYWRQFQEADGTLRNPETNIYDRLEDAGMEPENIDHVRNQYEEHFAPLLDGSMYEED
jgi:hypothetical protein